MAAVRFLAVCDLRRRWRSALALSLLVGSVGAVVLAAAAGARRSSSSLDRFVAFSRASDVEIALATDDEAQIAKFRSDVEQVADLAHLRVFAVVPHIAPNLKMGASVDGRLGTAVDRARVVAGRVPDPNVPNDIAIGESLAQQEHLHIGDVLKSDSMTPAQFDLIKNGHDPGAPAGPRVDLHIVGIVRRPLDLGDLSAAGGVVLETPAFVRAYSSRIGSWAEVLRVRTRHGASDVTAVTDAAHRVFANNLMEVSDVTKEALSGSDAISVMTTGLWVFTAVGAIAAAVALAIVFARELAQVAEDQETLDALGCTRRQRIAAVLLQTMLIAVVGATLAVIAAALASPLFPFGLARRAEPNPGFHIDALVLATGAALIIAFVLGLSVAIGVRVTRPAWRRPAPRPGRLGASVVDAASRSGLGPSVANGVRMAVDPGRGGTGVPLRSAYFGAIAGVAGLVALVVFSGSLAHVSSTPSLYGWRWDFAAPDNSFTSNCNLNDLDVGHVPGVTSVGAVCYSPVTIDGHPGMGYGFGTIRGTIGPEIVAGHAPGTPNEVALGAATMRAAGKHIGDLVTARSTHGQAQYRIVGQVALAQFISSDEQRLDSGAVFTTAGYAAVFDPNNYTRFVIGDYQRGANRTRVDARLNALPGVHGALATQAFATQPTVVHATRPPEINRLRQLDWFPPSLSLLLAVLALAAVGHAVFSAARRRRKELAMLKTLGFVRAQVRSTVSWQATMLGLVGVVVGIPLGLVVGTVAWHRLADSMGITNFTTVSLLVPLTTSIAVLVVVNLIAFFPARRAACAWPAAALASE